MNRKKNVTGVALSVVLRMGRCFGAATRLGIGAVLSTLILAGPLGMGSAWADEVLGVTLPAIVASTITQGGPPNNADTYVTPFVATQSGTITTWKGQFVGGQVTTGCGLPVGIQLKVLRATSATVVQVISAGAVHNPKAILEARFGGTCPAPQSESAESVIEFTETTGLAVSPGDIVGLTIGSDPDVDAYFYPLVSESGTTRLVLRDVAVGDTIDLDSTFTGTLSNLAPALEINNASGALRVDIDIKPGSFPNSINLGSGGTVPVAIFSTATFDATTVDPTTVTLASAPVKLKGQGTPMASFVDVNADGLLDLVVHVSTDALQISEVDTEAVLEGQTFDGTPITGVDTVRVVP